LISAAVNDFVREAIFGGVTMRRFELLEPKSMEEACRLLSDADSKPIAGGTALLTLIKQGLYRPKTLVNLKKIPGALAVQWDPGQGLRIGALATIHEVATAALVRQHYPMLSDACHVVANIRIRNMATIGGNLAHGDAQSDPPTALMALDASVELRGRSGQRRMKLSDFLLGSYETALASGELVVALTLPPAPQDLPGVYIKFTTGSSAERPCAGVAAMARLENGICRELRLALGAISPRPVRVGAGEEMARGKELSGELIDRIADEAARRVEPIDDVRGSADYKRHLAQVLTRRAIMACAAANPTEHGP
jgi:carbon-monoxide dehydrogenase medium subunit